MNDATEIAFGEKTFTQAALSEMSVEALLDLRNEVAESLGVAKLGQFADASVAQEQTWKALIRWQTKSNELTPEEGAAPTGKAGKAPKAPKAPKEPKEKKPRSSKEAKSADPKIVKRPTIKHFATIKIIKQHTGVEGRAHRWPNYKDGMMMIDVIEGKGTEPWDVYNWQKQGLLDIIEATNEEYVERRAEWFKKHGIVDPELNKEEQAEKRAEAAAAKKAAAEAKKAEKAAAKAAADEAAKAAPEEAPAEA